MLLFSLLAASLAAASPLLLSSREIHGDATFTGTDVGGGTCSFFNYTFPAVLYGTGIGPSNWNSGGRCGSCLQVNGPRGSVKVMVVDSCPSCKENRLNLHEGAFRQIADPSDGIIDVSFDVVSCGLNEPLSVRNKVGTSRWFFSMQVLNCNYPITDLEITTDGMNWESTVRQDYNFFEREDKSGFGADQVTVRISCSNGKQVIIPDVWAEGQDEVRAPVNC